MRAPRGHQRSPHREPRTREGGALLTRNHLAFLQGLLDRPGGRCRSQKDLIQAAWPYVARYRGSEPSWWCVQKATRTLPAVWVSRRRRGNRLEFRLLARGRAIVTGKVPARVRGMGPWAPQARGAGTPTLPGAIVIGTVENDGLEVVMIPQEEAESLARLHRALDRAATWGEFKRLAPREHYDDAVSRWMESNEEQEQPAPDQPFDAHDIPGRSDGDWPAWPAQDMLAWVPEEVQTRFGRPQASMLNGSWLSLRGEAIEEIIAAMERLGYRCRRDEALIARAHGI
jgi:hypothetical protein